MKAVLTFMALFGALLPPAPAQMPFSPADGSGFAASMPNVAPDAQPLTVTAGASVQHFEKGKPFFVALHGQVQEGWHAYFANPAMVGEAMTATLAAPQGFEVEGPFWSVPVCEESTIGVAYIYTQPVVVWKVTPTEAAPAQAAFNLSATAQICSEEGCLPPTTATATVELSEGEATAAPEWQEEQTKVVPLGDAPGVTYTATQPADAKSVTLTVTSPAPLQGVYFFSADNSITPTAAQTATQKDGKTVLVLPRNDGTNTLAPLPDTAAPGVPLKELRGVLAWQGGFCSVQVAPTTEAAAPAAEAQAETPAAQTSSAGLLTVCLSLFVGGLILNLMPCVFPVIGLKVMSFVNMGGGDRSKIMSHSLSFVAGILVSFWVIAALLLLLLDSGERSWALWMQNPWVVYGITLLLLVLALSMSGVFEIGLSATGAGQGLQAKGGLADSFFQGLLITVVATPCSAPFLGSAMPLAMALPPVWLVTALTAMALGLALPYLVLGLFPALISRLPRPGAWMESLKQGLSFLMYAAAAWFLFVYLSFADAAQGPWIMVGIVLVAAAFWVYGRWCAPYRSSRTRLIGLLVALLLLALGAWSSCPEPAAEEGQPEWVAWSPEAMQEALDDGTPVFVDFTAKWCATCQYNKKVAYSKEVYALMQDKNVVLMRADMTKPNEDITAELKRLQRSNVPVNALYLPDEKPAVTQELLSPGYLLDFLKARLDI